MEVINRDAQGKYTDRTFTNTSSKSDVEKLPRWDQMTANADGTYTDTATGKTYTKNGDRYSYVEYYPNGEFKQIDNLTLTNQDGRTYVCQQYIIDFDQYPDGKSHIVRKELVTVTEPGGSGQHFIEGSTYACASIDFSGMGTDFGKEDLKNLGFASTCKHGCGKYYSIQFVDDSDGSFGTNQPTASGLNYTSKVGSSYLIQIDISSLSNDSSGAEKLVQAIVEAASKVNGFDGHWEQYAYKKSEPAKLYLYENTRNVRSGSVSTWEPAARNEKGEQTLLDYSTNKGTVRYKENPDIHIQSSARGNEAIVIRRPTMSNSELGIEGLYVADYESAGVAITEVNRALEYVNNKRSYLGAMQNRLEYAMRNDDNTAENTDAAESRIRDTDMAEEMVNFSKHNILEQAGQSMLAQANQSTQGILSLIQ